MIFGKNLETQKAIEFLECKENDKRALIISGTEGSGKREIAKYSVKYVMDRTRFYDGAYYIDARDKSNT